MWNFAYPFCIDLSLLHNLAALAWDAFPWLLGLAGVTGLVDVLSSAEPFRLFRGFHCPHHP